MNVEKAAAAPEADWDASSVLVYLTAPQVVRCPISSDLKVLRRPTCPPYVRRGDVAVQLGDLLR